MTLKKFIKKDGSAILLNPAAFASVEKIDSNPEISPFIENILRNLKLQLEDVHLYDIRLINQYHYEVWATPECFSFYIEE